MSDQSPFANRKNDIISPVYIEINIGDIVRLRKKHPCGAYEWEVVRLGADIGLVCLGCKRRIMLPRGDFNKQFKSKIPQNTDTE